MNTKSESAEFLAGPPGATRTFGSDEGPRGTDPPPTRVGRYVILGEVGRGAMGVVWTAYDPKLDRKVAIKLLRASASTSTRQARFIREAQALAKLNHPNIVTVHDVDTHEGRLYMAMEYIDGQTLEQWLLAEPSYREVLDVFQRAGQGLAAAHAADITHRDFKPSNVLIAADGRVKVVDFGLAKHMGRPGEAPADELDHELDHELDRDENERDPNLMAMIESSVRGKLTKVGRIVGTPAYMAPEQYIPLAAGSGVGAFTDQFSFAVALYEALFCVLPFEGDDLGRIGDNVVAGNMRQPPRDSPVPGWIVRVIHRALALEPRQRYPSMQALLAALQADPARRRRRRLAYAGGVVLGGLAVLGIARVATPGVVSLPLVPCRGAKERLAGVWDDEAHRSVRAGLLATGRPFAADTAQRVIAGLDAYAKAWVAQHTSVCQATRMHGEQSEALLDVRMTCLDRRRSELGALVDVLATPRKDTVTVTAAVAAVTGLRPAEPCAVAQPGVENDLPTEPERRAQLLALQASVDHAGALLAAGHSVEARDEAAQVARAAAGTGLVRIQALALIVEGGALRQLHDIDAAQQRLREGITLASAVADVRTEIGGWLDLLYIAGVTLDEVQQAADWQFATENALRRAGSPKELEFKLALTVSAVRVVQHRLEEATQAGEDAWRLALETRGAGSLQHAQALNNLGVVAAKSGKWSLAEERMRESYELKQHIFGVDHPEVASNRMNLANALAQHAKELGDSERASALYDEAEQLYTQVVAFREHDERPNGTDVARALTMLGLLQLNRGRLPDARKTLERARGLLQSAPAAEDDLARVLANLAKVERLEQEVLGPPH